MAGKRGLKRNVTSNFGGYLVSVLIAFVVSPIIIRALGDARYGIWSLVAQITGYYGLLDLGIRGAISHYTARYLAREDPENLKQSLSTGFWFLAAIGGVLLFLGAGLALVFPALFEIEGAAPGSAQLAMLIMSTVIAINLPMASLSGALVGCERLDLVNGIEVSTRVLGAVATIVAMKSGGGLVALAWVQAGIAGARWLLSSAALFRIGEEFSLAPRFARRVALRDLAGYGGRSMLINIAMVIINNTDVIVIGVVMGTTWVTIYTIGQMLVLYISSAGNAVSHSFVPRLTHASSREDRAELERVYLLGARTTASVVAPVAGCVFAFGTPFIALWIGPKYVTGPWGERSDLVMVLLLLAHTPRVLQSISWQLLFATRTQGFLARLTCVEAAANLVLSLALVKPLGLIGIALGTLLPLAVSHLVVLPRFIASRFGIPSREFLRRGVGGPVLVGVALFAFGFVLRTLIPPTTWFTFSWQAALTAAVGVPLMWRLAIDAEARALLARRASRLLGRTR